VPCYQAAEHLNELVETARRQTHPFAEIVAFDDGSNDETEAIARSLGIRCLREIENRGAGYARNRLLEAARCPFVHLHDADDPFSSEKFVERLVPYLTERRLAFCSWQTKRYDGSKIVFQYDHLGPSPEWSRVLIHSHIHLNAMIVPRDFALAHGGFSEQLRLQQDLHFNLRLALAGIEFHWVPELLAEHRHHAKSTLGQINRINRQKASLQFCRITLETLPNVDRKEIGEKALFHGLELAREGSVEGLEEAVQIAAACGVRRLPAEGRALRLIERLLGMRAALRYQASRSRRRWDTRAYHGK
jgi:glycosyltransferase involved in cell wall biosynthesis